MQQPQNVLQAIGGLGATELILILLIVLLIFGAGKLPQLGDALGRGIRNFKNATAGKKDEPVDVTPKAIEDKDGKARKVEVETPEKNKA
jgi:sec-independent protein translocase protein TatA